MKATGFRKTNEGLVVGSQAGDVIVSPHDFTRVLTIMCENAPREMLDALHRVVTDRRSAAAERWRQHAQPARRG